jgi:hypothetical protein
MFTRASRQGTPPAAATRMAGARIRRLVGFLTAASFGVLALAPGRLRPAGAGEPGRVRHDAGTGSGGGGWVLSSPAEPLTP